MTLLGFSFGGGTKLLVFGHGELGMGNWELGMGHGAWGMGQES
jgi:hypothetical protein